MPAYTPVQQNRAPASVLDTVTLLDGQIAVEQGTGRVRSGDGATVGGYKLALLSDIASDLSFQGPGAGSVVRAFLDKLKDTTSVLDFIPQNLHAGIGAGTDTTDLSAYLANAAAYATKPFSRLVFPSGIYTYSVSPNWAGDYTRITADGEVRLRYTGTGNAVILDSGAVTGIAPNIVSPAGKHGMRFGPFIVEAGPNSSDGVFLRAIHHSEIYVNVRGCGPTNAAVRCLFGVCTDIHVVCSQVEGYFYQGAQPGYGVYLDARTGDPSDAGTASFITLKRPIIEGPKVGVVFANTIGCKLDGGTVEACASYGIDIQSGAYNTFIDDTDCEANSGFDVRDNGAYTSLRGMQTLARDYSGAITQGVIVGASSRNLNLVGGRHNIIQVAAGATNASIVDTVFAYDASGFLSDAGNRTLIRNAINLQTGKRQDGMPGRAPVTLPASATSAAPFTYTNNTGNMQTALINGGTGLNLYFIGKTGVGDAINATGVMKLAPGEGLQFVYTAAPTLIIDG